MARKRPKRPSGQRDHLSHIDRSLQRLGDSFEPVLPPPAFSSAGQPKAFHRDPVRDLLSIEDRRTWHPEQHTAAGVPHRSPRRWNSRIIEIRTRARPKLVRSRLILQGGRRVVRRVAPPVLRFRFERPEAVALCVRRRRRRQVLFALRRTGRGSRSPRRYNRSSSIYCR